MVKYCMGQNEAMRNGKGSPSQSNCRLLQPVSVQTKYHQRGPGYPAEACSLAVYNLFYKCQIRFKPIAISSETAS